MSKLVSIPVSVASVDGKKVTADMARKAREMFGWQATERDGFFTLSTNLEYEQPETVEEALAAIGSDGVVTAVIQYMDKTERNKATSKVLNALAMRETPVIKGIKVTLGAFGVDVTALDGKLTDEQRFSEDFWKELLQKKISGQ
jgi:hypothetical protein